MQRQALSRVTFGSPAAVRPLSIAEASHKRALDSTWVL